MTRKAQLFDGTMLEFPDDTPDSVIMATVKKQTQQRKLDSYKASDPAEYDPTSPEYKQKYGAVSGNSFLDNFNIGVGKFFTDVGLGSKQMLGLAPASAADEKKRLDAAVMDTAGGNVGYIGGAMAAGAPIAMAAGATVPGAMLAGGVIGAAQPASSMGERYLRTGQDMATAGLATKGINAAANRAGSYLSNVGRVYTPKEFPGYGPGVRATYAPDQQGAAGAAGQGAAAATAQAGAGANVSVNPNVTLRQQSGISFGSVGADPSAGLSRTQQALADWGQSQGLRLTPGQASGSRALQQFEAKLQSQPMTSGPFNRIQTENAKRINEIVAKSIGENSKEVSGDVLDSANTRLGEIFDLARNKDITVMADPAASKSVLDGLESDLAGLVPDGTFSGHPLVKMFEQQVSSGSINGEQLGGLSSKLSRAAYKEMTSPSGDRDLGMALSSLKEHVDDLLETGMSPEFRAQYAEARKQYRNLINITASKNTINTGTGDVRGRSLASTLKSKDKKGYLYGRNQSDLYNAARFSEAFAPVVGDSGTATRSPLPSSSLEMALGIPVNIATRAYTSSTATAAAAAAAKAKAGASQALAPFGAAVDRGTAYGGSALPYLLPGYLSGTRNR